MCDVKLLPGFDKYGLLDDEIIVSFRNGTWMPLKADKAISLHRSGMVTTIKRAKFIFCVRNQIDPTLFHARGFCIDNQGKLITYSQRTEKRNLIVRGKKKNKILESIKDEKEWLSSLETFYKTGDATLLLTKIEKYKPLLAGYIAKNYGVPISFAKSVVDEAELQLFTAIENQGVVSAGRWIEKRSVGIIKDKRRNLRRIGDYEHIKGI